jgi:hypothetical protein
MAGQDRSFCQAWLFAAGLLGVLLCMSSGRGADREGGKQQTDTAPAGTEFDSTDGDRFVHFGPGGTKVVLTYFAIGERSYARVDDAETGKPLTPPLVHFEIVSYAAFSPDGKKIVTGCGDGRARLWDAQTGKELTPPLRHGNIVTRAVFSPDGKRVLTASAEEAVRTWDAQTGKEVGPTLKHEPAVGFAAFSPDGKRVVTASGSPVLHVRTALLWDAATGKQFEAMQLYVQSARAAMKAGAPPSVGVTVAKEKIAEFLKKSNRALLDDVKARVPQLRTDKSLSPSARQLLTDLWALYTDVKDSVDNPRGALSSYAAKARDLEEQYNRLLESLKQTMGIEDLD